MTKKTKKILIAILIAAAVFSYRSNIAEFLGSFTAEKQDIKSDSSNNRSSYEHYYKEYTSCGQEAEGSSDWAIYTTVP